MMKRTRIIFLILTLAVMIFIFVQSAMPADLSGAESGPLARLLAGFFGAADDPAALDLADLIVRKIAHFLEYLVLGFCLAVNVRDWKWTRISRTPDALDVPQASASAHSSAVSAALNARLMVLAWLIGTAYAVTDEIHQLFVPDRACAFADVCIDATGVAVGVVMCVMKGESRSRSSQNPK